VHPTLSSLVLATALAGLLPAQAPTSTATTAPTDAPAVRWWKGNLHTHSLWSDGDDFPEVIADWYKRHGYHFLAISDHNVLSEGERWMKVDDVVRRGGRLALARYRETFGQDWVETRETDGKQEVRLRGLAEFRPLLEQDGQFLLLQAEELSAVFDRLPLHVNATNLLEVVLPRGGGSVRDTLAKNLEAIRDQAHAHDHPILAHLNHPNFHYAVTAEDLAEVLQERFFEVYNGHPQVHHEGDDLHASVERLWDIANTLRIARLQAPPLYGLGTDDSHHYFAEAAHLSNTGRGWIMVRAEALQPATLIAAIECGDFYASSGVTLRDASVRDGVLHVEAEPVEGETHTIRFVGTKVDHDPTFAPVRDADGKLVRATFRYSADVGAVLAEHTGDQASYRLTGDELYVRAVVTSSAAPARPVHEGQKKQAWTQPVGWQQRVRLDRGPRFSPTTCPGEGSTDLRGITTDRIGRVYWSFPDALVATDAAGALVRRTEATAGHGDLTFWNGELHVAVDPLRGGRPGPADSWVHVHDANTLALVRRHRVAEVTHGARAIVSVGGRFFVAGGVAPGAETTPVFEYDAFYRFVRRHEVAGGRRIDTAEFADGRLWFGSGGAAPAAEPALLVTDLDLAVLQQSPFDAARGIAGVEDGRFLVGRVVDASTAQPSTGQRAAALLAHPDPEAGLRLPGSPR
jgi:hypothetical protein